MGLLGQGEFVDSMNQMQHSNMLVRMLTGQGGAEGIMGSLMSRGMAVGKPLASMAMGMAGLDPLSLGLKAGSAVWGSGAGLLGAGVAGAGVMAGAGLGLAGMAYAGNQMMTGAQQQMHLNQSLQGPGFNFMNFQGGRGFTNAQGFDIGRTMRGMTEDRGVGGEQNSFDELSRLAANMGKMGLAQNVRTVADFKEKFKSMVDTLKIVAQDLGSTMEEAQKFIASAKASGIFQKADQLKLSAGIRTAATAGGLATTEVSNMVNIGSQISRMVGGTGRAGAFAGIKTISDIGAAQQIGAISEEDIYNATGQTGAEGRAAFATLQLQQSASFLKGGHGRRFLASIAGKNGQLDESSDMEYMLGGGVSTGRTMEMAQSNLGGVGRANFIRNEGRLRGAALEKFGGMAESMVYSQWLQEHNLKPRDLNDRSMLAFQRFSGLGRDEADLAIKQVDALPDILQEQDRAGRTSKQNQRISNIRKTTGMLGFQGNVKKANEQLNSYFQELGSKILEAGSEKIETWMNDIMGVYVQEVSKEAEKAYESAVHGTGGTRAWEKHFGTGRPRGVTKSTEGLLNRFNDEGIFSGFASTSMASKFYESGYVHANDLKTDLDVEKLLKQSEAIAKGSRAGSDTGMSILGKANAARVQQVLLFETAGTGGEERLKRINDALLSGRAGSDIQRSFTEKQRAGDWYQLANIVGSLAKGSGVHSSWVQGQFSVPEGVEGLNTAMGGGRYTGEAARARGDFSAIHGRTAGELAKYEPSTTTTKKELTELTTEKIIAAGDEDPRKVKAEIRDVTSFGSDAFSWFEDKVGKGVRWTASKLTKNKTALALAEGAGNWGATALTTTVTWGGRAYLGAAKVGGELVAGEDAGGNPERDKAESAELQTEEYQELRKKLLSDDSRVRAEGEIELNKKMASLSGKGNELSGKEGAYMDLNMVRIIKARGGVEKLTEFDIKGYAGRAGQLESQGDKKGTTLEHIKRMYQGVSTTEGAKRAAEYQQLVVRAAAEGTAALEGMETAGGIEQDETGGYKLTQKAIDEFAKDKNMTWYAEEGGGGDGRLRYMSETQKIATQAKEAAGLLSQGNIEGSVKVRSKMLESLTQGTTAEKLERARSLTIAGSGEGAKAQYQVLSREKRYTDAFRGVREGSEKETEIINKALGLGMGEEAVKGAKFHGADGEKELVARMIGSAKVSDEERKSITADAKDFLGAKSAEAQSKALIKLQGHDISEKNIEKVQVQEENKNPVVREQKGTNDILRRWNGFIEGIARDIKIISTKKAPGDPEDKPSDAYDS